MAARRGVPRGLRHRRSLPGRALGLELTQPQSPLVPASHPLEFGSHHFQVVLRAKEEPHCVACGGGESVQGNEILLCDGKGCEFASHQKCCDPPLETVPAGAWLCVGCVASGNAADDHKASSGSGMTTRASGSKDAVDEDDPDYQAEEEVREA